jgi:hypothetical protein
MEKCRGRSFRLRGNGHGVSDAKTSQMEAGKAFACIGELEPAIFHCPLVSGMASNPSDKKPGAAGSGRTVEDEQCQRIGGGHEATKFRFLLFL